MRQKKVLLLGSYGQSNLGDDLLMWNYLHLLRSRGYDDIYVNANTYNLIPEEIKKAFPHLHVVLTYKTSAWRYVQLIRQVDCIVYGGGTLYKELYASTGRSPYSVITRLMGFNVLAWALGTRVYHLNIGIGSLKTRRGRWITSLALRAATTTTFRDAQSYEFARDTLRLPAKKILRSVDGLFLNPIWRSSWHKSTLTPKKHKRTIGVNALSDIPDWVNREDYIAAMQTFVTALLERGDRVVLFPFQTAFNPRNDLVFMREVFASHLKEYDDCQILEEVPIDRIQSSMSQCDLFVGMRFHSLLLAAAGGVPFVALAYDTKCWRFIEETDYPFALKLEDLTEEALLAMCDHALAARGTVEQKLQAVADTMYEKGEDSLRTLSL
jgi:polysaccharide pyruvyl transferase WcaK-like protein